MLTGKSFVLRKACTGITTDFEREKEAFSSRLALSSKYKEGQFRAAASWMFLGRARHFLCSVKVIQEHGEPLHNHATN